MSWYTGRLAEVERSPDGPWARMRLDDGTRLYIHEDRLLALEQQLGNHLSRATLRFCANPLLKRVQDVELVEAPPGWGFPIPFEPDPSRPTWNTSRLYGAMLESMIRAIPVAPARNGIEISLQRTRRHAAGVLDATPENPYFPDPEDERESFLVIDGYLRANPEFAKALDEEARAIEAQKIHPNPRGAASK